ncbi:MFS transporter [Nonomuraea jiangxiensis]|uniref:MFS transporter, DHA2 family, multidrug resistance protein n=1 Tax=Nonomuraea jiangxiensis TaxID=633440 RepID=A0A1G8YGJ0_9ACTN|nr:MFS transporter [Nonomuraea jiangxiensis]SDK01767.1 MFS transporter, DHA2 family, multidrug resistance protein [Nonomuraea jiangxiensis]
MQHHTPVAEPIRAGRREWAGLAVLALPTLLAAVDINVLFLALPGLSADLGADGVDQLWITDIYGFMVAGLVITMGTLGDRIGRRRLLLTGAAAFGVASVLAAYAVTPAMLIACRALLGIAGATLAPSTLALITNMFRDDRQRGTAISIWATCQFAGAALGPVVGGLLLEHFWWGSVFLLAVPVIVVLLAGGALLLPEHRDPGAGRLDLTSVALSLLAILPIVWGIKTIAASGAGVTAMPVAAILAGCAFGAGFVRRQLRLADPLLNLRLLAQRPVTLVLTALVLAGVAMAGVGLPVTQYLQTVLGYSPTQAALWFAPMGLAVALGTMLTPAVTRRLAPRAAIAGGLVLSALGSGLLTLDGGLPAVVAGITVLALGTGPLFALGTGIVVGSVRPERAGSAASLTESGNYLGGTLGLAVLGTVAAAVYRLRMAATMPSGVPDDVARQAQETVAAAVSYGGEVTRAAHSAYTDALSTVGLIGAVLFVVTALLMGLLPRV